MRLFIGRLLSVLILCFLQHAHADCIGLVTAGGGKAFWDDVIAGAKKAGAELGFDIYDRGAIDETNDAGQRKIIRSTMALGCRALVLAPNSDDRRYDVEVLKNKGIPTVYIDRDMAGERVSVIRTENYLAGKRAGQEMAKALGGKGKIALLRMSPEVISTTERENGFKDGALEAGLDIVIDQYIGTLVGEARTHSHDVLEGFVGLGGVFTPNESTSVAVHKSLSQLHLTKSIIHIGFDAHQVMINALKNNSMHGFMIQDPFKMGYMGVTTAVSAINEQPYAPEIFTEAIFVYQKNLQNPKIKALLGEN